MIKHLWLALLSSLLLAEGGWARRPPPLFNDNLLPYASRSGQNFETLGRIVPLDTLLPPKRPEEINAVFGIFNRRQTTEDLVFKVGQEYCIQTGISNTTGRASNSTSKAKESCYGPYPLNLTAMAASEFNPKTRTVIMISGFMTNSYSNTWLERTKDLWLELEDMDVILISWSNANKYLYSRAVADTPLIARQITIFLHYLAQLSGTHLNEPDFVRKIHFVGHSLGAHIGAYVGQDLAGRMGRITGLDPAGPSYDQMPIQRRLDPTDAQLVDVIHTNSGKLKYANFFLSAGLRGIDMLMSRISPLRPLAERINERYNGEGDTAWYGIDAQVGHLDYYANGGSVQPGCNDIMHLCDHGRSNKIYESILAYERALGNLTKSERKQARLLAFAAQDYSSFLTGENLSKYCPKFLKSDLSNPQLPTLRCTMPIDLITPVEELKHELITSYGLNFNPDRSLHGRKYFFKTMSEKPFVGDHYLLKVRLDPTSSWNQGCALQVAIGMSDEIGTAIDINKELKMINSHDFYGMAIPFVNPYGDVAHNTLVEIVRASNNRSSLEAALNSTFTKVLPTQVSLSITNARSSSLFEAIGQSLLRAVTFNMNRRLPQDCRLIVNSLEVEPIMTPATKLASVYSVRRSSNQRSDIDQPTNNGTVRSKPKLLTRKEYGIRSRQGRASRPLFELASVSSKQSITVDIDAMIYFD